MKPGKSLSIFLFITFSLAVLASVSAMTVMYFFRQEDRMAYGLQLAGQPITGLSRSETKKLLEKKLVPQLERKALVLTYEHKSWQYKPADIGLQADIPATVDAAYSIGRKQGLVGAVIESLSCALQGRNVTIVTSLDETRLKAALEKPAKEIGRPAQNATVSVGPKDVIHTPSQDGLELNVSELIDTLRDPLLALQLPQQHEVILNHTAPKVKSEDLKGVDTVLGSYSTYFIADSDRGENVRLAASKLNGVILPSGGDFSFNKTVGPRDVAAGYLDAPVIIGGRVEPGIGGGVCQVSSTLYNAILLANLTPTDRQPHYYPSSYCPAGLDATVADGLIDFCFKNSLANPVVLLSSISGDELTFHVLGSSADHTADIYLETYNPAKNRYISYRVYEKDGVEINREHLYTDDYDDPPPPDKKPDPNKPKPEQAAGSDSGSTVTSAPEPAPAPAPAPEEKKKKRRHRS